MLRIAPFIPFFVVNIAPALFNVRLKTFVAATLLGILPGAFAYAWLGQGLDSVLIAAKAAGRDVDDFRSRYPRDHHCLRRAGACRRARHDCKEGLGSARAVSLRTRRDKARSSGKHFMAKVLTPDICVIGAGSGGLSVAAAAAAFGVKVVLVEKGRMGGDCLNYGCVPSKALIAAAKQADAMRSGEKFGIGRVEPEIDFKAVMRHVHGVIAAIAPNDSVERFAALGVTVIKAEARFKDRRTLIAGDTEIRARRFVLATGSSPVVPPIPGLDSIDYLTNETVFDLNRRPGHLIVIGGGPIGIELAQAFRRLGSQVTVIEAATVLAKDDPEMAAVVVRKLRAEGVIIRERTKVTSVERRGKTGVKVLVETRQAREEIDGSHLLIATGRVANTQDSTSRRPHVAIDGQAIDVSAMLRTTNRRIYAIGDVIGAPQFTHVANYHASLSCTRCCSGCRPRTARSFRGSPSPIPNLRMSA